MNIILSLVWLFKTKNQLTHTIFLSSKFIFLQKVVPDQPICCLRLTWSGPGLIKLQLTHTQYKSYGFPLVKASQSMVSIIFLLCRRGGWKILKFNAFLWIRYKLEIWVICHFFPVKSNIRAPLEQQTDMLWNKSNPVCSLKSAVTHADVKSL